MSNNLSLQLIPAADYYTRLLHLIPQAQQRIVLHAMIISWTPELTHTLLPTLRDALQRGVRVELVGDIYTKPWLTYLSEYTFRSKPGSMWQHARAINHELSSLGAHITYIGRIKANPFKGRCHSKITIIDDNVFTFGGVNYSDASFTNNDYMFEIRDRAVADRFEQLVHAIATDRPVMDNTSEALDTATTLLFDGGTPDTSIIYDTACALVSRAERTLYVSQFPPSGRLGKIMAQKSCNCYFNRPSQGDFPFSLAFAFDARRYGTTNHYKHDTYIHAKYILTEDADGSKHVLSGSNNFSWSGIHFGTKEIAMHSTDPAIWQALATYTKKYIA
jgi:cardiolipin synthase